MLAFLAAGTLDFLMINASDEITALMFARGLVLALIFAGFLYLSTNLAFIPLSKWLEKNRVLYSVMSVMVGLVVAYNLSSLEHNQFGYGLPVSLGSFTTWSWSRYSPLPPSRCWSVVGSSPKTS